MIARYKLWTQGRWVESKKIFEVHSPYTGEVVAQVDRAESSHLDTALETAGKTFLQTQALSRHIKSQLLSAIAVGIKERKNEFTHSIVYEAGKPFQLAEAEVGRAVTTFTVASEEAKRFGGDVIPVDIDAAGRSYFPALSLFVPRGPVLAIAPFNFPLNLVAHKVAPALAVGASVVIKPASQTPGAATLLAEVFESACKQVSDKRETIPLGMLQVLHCSSELANQAVSDPRISVVSFTGSPQVGWSLQERATRKKVALELGGNAAVIVHQDADLKRAANRVCFGAFAYAGQVCISVQRVYVHKDVYSNFEKLFLEEVSQVVVGDPTRKETLVGPLIDKGACDRVVSWIEEAKNKGAKLLTRLERKGNVLSPVVLTDVPSHLPLYCEEAFGPVVILEPYEDFSKAIEAVNDSHYGLQAGLFTDSASLIREAFYRIEVGGLTINEVPTYRADNMPYGGVKDSGLGREGVRFAMEEYSERRTLVSWQG